MAFSGTELLEVAPTDYFAVGSGGGKVFAIAAGSSGASGYAAVMDTATGESVLYTIPTHYGGRGLSLHADYQSGKAWVASSSHWIDSYPCMFASITATLDRYRPGSPEHTVAAAMHDHGVMCGDKSSYGDPTKGRMVVACALDSRIGTVDLGLSMSDFEVVAQ